jgi:hypothetical protein
MRKIKGETLHKGPGRPSMGCKTRGISLSDEDADILKSYGFGGLSAGIRRAAHLIRKQEVTQ